MPCENCSTQFTIFKRKRSCNSCQRLYCANCLGKRKKNQCYRCEVINQKPAPTKQELLDLKTRDLIFYLQSKKINIAGIVEKEELANLIINHVNSNSYYEQHSSTSTTPNHDFENYTQSFDQIKQTCQNLFTSISDKISSDFQKTSFNQPNQQSRFPTTQQPRRPSTAPGGRSNPVSPHSPPPPEPAYSHRTDGAPSHSRSAQPREGAAHSRAPEPLPSRHLHEDCNCSDDEMDEITEKRQSIFDGVPGPSGCASQKKAKLATSSSSESSSFEDVGASAVKQSDDSWQVIETTASNGVRTVSDDRSVDDSAVPSGSNQTRLSDEMRSAVTEPITAEARRMRRRSDSQLLGLRKSNSITIDASSFDPTQSGSEVKKLKISCNKCGKAKSNIKKEILKLSEQLKSSNKSEAEVNAKIKEFLDYLESKSQPSEMTEDTHTDRNDENASDGARFVPNSTSHDEIEEDIFDQNEGIHVYPVEESDAFMHSSPSIPRKFIQLADIHSSDELETLSVKQLKEILMLNRVDFKGCCEKQELKERVFRLWQDARSAPPSEKLPSDDLCKICMDAPIECVFLECGHAVTCTACGKVLSECPICRSYIVRVVRIFKS